MNTQKRWLFERVHSVGALIPTSGSSIKTLLETEKLPAAKRKVPMSEPALAAVSGIKSYFLTRNPDEKGEIMARMKKRESVGMSDEHFWKYEHMICFDLQTHKLLEKMRSAVAAAHPDKKLVAVVHQHEAPEVDEKDLDSMRRITGKIKAGMKGFIIKHFAWERPAIGIACGEWRTLQIVINGEAKKKVESEKWLMIGNVFNKKGCKVHVNAEPHGMWLVSVSGPNEKLAEARKMMGI